MDTLLSPAQVATRLAVSDQTVLNMIDRNELPALRISQRVIRVDPDDLEIFLLARRTQPIDSISISEKLGQGTPLTDDEWLLLEKAVGKLARAERAVAVYISGSYAAGDPDMQSDLDFVVVTDERLDFFAQRPFLVLTSRLAKRPDVAFMTSDQFARERGQFSVLRPLYARSDHETKSSS